MTESDAKTKWCPFSRVIPIRGTAMQGGFAACNRTHDVESDAKHGWPTSATCIGSACMAWRWTYFVERHKKDPMAHGEGGPAQGYCGLAGKP